LFTVDANSVFRSLYNVDGGGVATNLYILTVHISAEKGAVKDIFTQQ
jgi:hypothetical protein